MASHTCSSNSSFQSSFTNKLKSIQFNNNRHFPPNFPYPRSLTPPSASLRVDVGAPKARVETGKKTKEVIEDEAKFLVGTYARVPVVLEKGKGCKLYDVEGNEYLDLSSGIAVNALGHGDDDWLKAVVDQAGILTHTSNVYLTIPQVELAKRLVGSSFADRVFFSNSGTEANEAAIKFSRKYQKHTCTEGKAPATEFIAFSNCFHGRTMGAVALTSKVQYRTPFEPVMPGVNFIEYGNAPAAVELIQQGKIAAVFVEPIQGEGGIYSATKEFLQSLRNACDEAGTLLVFDEVQCGLGRTGHLWAHEAYGVFPDIMTLAKPLAGGLPIGAVLLTERVASSIKYGEHGSTFAGGPLICNVALAVLNKISKPNFLSDVSKKGLYFKELLKQKLGGNPHVKEIRGVGLIIGIDLDVPASPLVDACRNSGLLILTAGKGNVVRLVPPLFPFTLLYAPLLNPRIQNFKNSNFHSQIPSSMSSWSCHKCTFLNPPSQISECQICSSSPPPPSLSPSPSSSSISPKWSCKSCTLFNSYKNSTCHLCGTRSHALSVSTFHDLTEIEHDDSVGSVFLPLRSCKRKAVDSAEDSAQPLDSKRSCNPIDLTEKDDSGKGLSSLKILSYNVWFREDLELHKRMKAIGDLVQLHSPDIICFQEVTPDIYDIFKRSSWWNVYHCSVSSDKAHSRSYFCMLLSKLPVKSFSTKSFSNSIMGRELCIAEVEDVSGKSLVVATSHLESPSPAPPKWDQMFTKERVEQANEALNILKRYPNVVFGGDMNWDEKKDGQYPLQDGWVDAWSELRPNETGWTYDTKSNQMLTGNRTLQKRLDRFVCHLRDLEISSIDMIGMDEIPGVSHIKEKKVRSEIKQLVLPVLPSDHYGLLLTISSK